MRNGLKQITGSVFTIGAVATGMMLAANARADVFNTTLASPDTNAATGSPTTGNNSGNNTSWYNGAGNPQGGWTVSTDPTSGIEVGLRAKNRNVNGIIATSTDDYSVTAGECLALPCSATPKPAYALWNYEFSIDLRPNGVGTLTLAGIAANTILTVTDVTTGATGSVNPLTHWVDDSGFGSGAGGAGGITSTGKHIPETLTDWGVQNSENLGFGDSPLAGVFNPNSSDEYDFSLQVFNNDGRLLGSTDMEVFATPEPSAIILLSTMILGLFVVARRRAIRNS